NFQSLPSIRGVSRNSTLSFRSHKGATTSHNLTDEDLNLIIDIRPFHLLSYSGPTSNLLLLLLSSIMVFSLAGDHINSLSQPVLCVFGPSPLKMCCSKIFARFPAIWLSWRCWCTCHVRERALLTGTGQPDCIDFVVLKGHLRQESDDSSEPVIGRVKKVKAKSSSHDVGLDEAQRQLRASLAQAKRVEAQKDLEEKVAAKERATGAARSRAGYGASNVLYADHSVAELAQMALEDKEEILECLSSIRGVSRNSTLSFRSHMGATTSHNLTDEDLNLIIDIRPFHNGRSLSSARGMELYNLHTLALLSE
ncbi:hypothetical protein SFRURICE_015287, partial [Spodoptera frugiperda]